eukprot:5497206-Karenia_brevis.AAC.1
MKRRSTIWVRLCMEMRVHKERNRCSHTRVIDARRRGRCTKKRCACPQDHETYCARLSSINRVEHKELDA